MSAPRSLTIVAHGRPAPQGSKDFGAHGQLREASRFLPAWRRRVKLEAMRARAAAGHETFTGPVCVKAAFYLERPVDPEHDAYPLGPPDVDKLLRAVLDGLTAAGVYVDDSRVVRAVPGKFWTHSLFPHPGAEITVEDWS